MVNLDDYRARIAQLESERESMNGGWRKRVEELEAERDALQKDVLELHRDTDEQFKEIEDHAFETATLKKHIAELEAERDALKNEIHEWEESDAADVVLGPGSPVFSEITK